MATGGTGERFRPLHDAHAIEQVLATVQFERPLPDEAVRAAVAAIDQFQTDLGGFHDLRGLGFQFGPAGLIPMPPSVGGAPDGRVRFKTDAAGVVLTELRIDRQALVFRTQAYTRWDAVWEEALRYFSGVLPSVNGVNVASFGLQYVDKFVWSGSPSTCRAASLIKPGSPYVSARTFDSADLWHCHSGQFRRVDDKVKRLEVVDIDCLDEPQAGAEVPSQQRFVRVSTATTDFFNQPGYQAHPISGAEALAQSAETFPSLHQEQKRVISEILNDDNAALIGLTKNDAE